MKCDIPDIDLGDDLGDAMDILQQTQVNICFIPHLFYSSSVQKNESENLHANGMRSLRNKNMFTKLSL